MKIGDLTLVAGCITKEKFVAGRTLRQIETILGFHRGRFGQGITVVALLELPAIDEFDLAAYSNIATHRFKMPADLNIEKLKTEARISWAVSGFERLVKVLPDVRHNPSLDPDVQYPPGHGAPQWVAKRPLRGRVVAIVTEYPNGRYVASDSARAF